MNLFLFHTDALASLPTHGSAHKTHIAGSRGHGAALGSLGRVFLFLFMNDLHNAGCILKV
jgi:hypothetical protein